jgi:hypothetical protein
MRNFTITRNTSSISERLSGIFHGLVIAMVAGLTLVPALHFVASIA